MVKTEYDYTELEKLIADRCGSKAEFCRISGMSESLLSQKLKRGVGFSQKDISHMSVILSIQKTDIGRYFFTTRLYTA